ncbi:MAG: SDR family oxidoreductase [Alphaproteobacteria bacterium]
MGDRLKGKVAVVTGAGSSGPGWGNGKAVSVLFAREGAKVFGIDINPAAVEETAGIVKSEKGEFTAHVADLTKDDGAQGAMKACLDRYGRIDILQNNVGIYETGSIESRDLAYWNRALALNLTTMFLSSKYALPQMVKQGTGGAVVNLASVASLRYIGPDYSIYTTTKAAVLGFSRQIALEYAPHKIRVNAVLPGVINTPLVLEPIRQRVSPQEFQKILGDRESLAPIGRAGTAWDVANASLFLVSEDAGFITGAELLVDGGMSCKTR